jgi:hypothetical membrane protein
VRATAGASGGPDGVPAGRRAAHDRARRLRRGFAVVGAVAALGFGLAMMNATSREWYWQNASTLGIDPGSKLYFNLTMIVLGVLFIGVAGPLRDQLAEVGERGLIRQPWLRVYRLGLALIPVALVAVGCFHIGGAQLPHMIHNIAGFTIPLVPMAMMLTLRWAIPVLAGAWRASLVVLAVIVGLFVLACIDAISYSLMEILSFIICWAWLRWYALRVEGLLGATPGPLPAPAAG